MGFGREEVSTGALAASIRRRTLLSLSSVELVTGHMAVRIRLTEAIAVSLLAKSAEDSPKDFLEQVFNLVEALEALRAMGTLIPLSVSKEMSLMGRLRCG